MSDVRLIAMESDQAIMDLAMQFAPRLREHCADTAGEGDDSDIAMGLMVRAAAAAAVKYAKDMDQLCTFTGIMQNALARRVNDILCSGRPVGGLHS